MRREVTTAAIAVLLFTVLLGIAYPLAMTGAAQVVFPGKANGSKIEVDGKVVGSSLLGQRFTGLRYFHSRPSATGYDPAATYFSNRGPNDAEAVTFYRDRLRQYIARERPYTPGLEARDVPVDAVTTSASGVDPHVSPANAAVQAHRIAAVRRLPLARVKQLIDEHTDGRFLGLVGEPGVNVLELNIALDKEAK